MSIPVRPDLARIPGALPQHEAQGTGHPHIIDGPHGPVLAPPPKGLPVIFPWWLYEMPQSTDWELNSGVFSAALNATTAAPNFSLTLKQGEVGVLSLLSFLVQNPTTTMDLTFIMKINDAPVVGWSSIKPFPLNATAWVKDYNGLVVRMKQGDKLTASVVEASGTAYNVAIEARGWITPAQVVEQFQSGVPY